MFRYRTERGSAGCETQFGGLAFVKCERSSKPALGKPVRIQLTLASGATALGSVIDLANSKLIHYRRPKPVEGVLAAVLDSIRLPLIPGKHAVSRLLSCLAFTPNRLAISCPSRPLDWYKRFAVFQFAPLVLNSFKKNGHKIPTLRF